jgi:hypothetical protein
MPKRTDIQSIMIIGAGPIVIGPASLTTRGPSLQGCAKNYGSFW